MRHIKPLDELTPDVARNAGGKAYQCGRLLQAGFDVPAGLVVLTDATDDDIAGLPHHPWFESQPPDTLYAVRSSAADEDGGDRSFAGIHETRLDVARRDVPAAVQACRASVRSPRALAYRHTKRMVVDRLESGVLVQRMVRAVASGVAFTIDPVTGATDAFVVNASWGLGADLVSGLVGPDEFHIRKRDGEVLNTRIGEKGGRASAASLSAAQLKEIGVVLSAVEAHYGAPQDVEWCHDGRQVWIVQSRPVTAAPNAAGRAIEWTRANFVEVLPELTSPQALEALEDLLNRAEQQFLGRLIARENELGPVVKAFNGRLYFNLSQLRRVCAIGGVPAAHAMRSMGHHGAIDPEDERPALVSTRDRLAHLPDLLRIATAHLRAGALVRRQHEAIAAVMAEWGSIDAESAPDGVLWSAMEEWDRRGPDHMQIVLTLAGVLFYEAPIRRVCEKAGLPAERVLYPQLAAGERSVSAQQAFDLVDLAEVARSEPEVARRLLTGPIDMDDLRRTLHGSAFLSAFERFVDRYGHRGMYETDWALPRFREDPTPILAAVRAHLQSPGGKTSAALAERQTREAGEAWRDLEGRLTRWQRWTLLPRARFAVRRIKQYYVWRERCRFEMMRIIAVLRAWHLVLARRFVDRRWIASVDDYFLLTRGEIAAALRSTESASALAGIARARAAEWARFREIEMPLLMKGTDWSRPVAATGAIPAARDGDLTGHGVSGGSVEADVVVILDPAHVERMIPGAILVTRATDPSWTPLFTLASGVIVEVGGVLSHASTIAREFGLPAIANVRHATTLLRTGERVRLDADAGIVRRVPAAVAEGGTAASRSDVDAGEIVRG